MDRQDSDRLERAHDELRSWCHERPDVHDPSTVYAALGSLNAIIATLEHIIDVARHGAERATGTDDGRTVADAATDIARHGRAASAALEQAYREVADAHAVTSHLIFASVEDCE